MDRRRTHRMWLGAVAATVALLVGCAPATDSSPAPSPTTATPSSATVSWTATTLEGKKLDAQSLMGKPALLWFWAPWCPICSGQVGDVREAVQKYGRRVTIIGVGGLDSAAAIRRGDEVIPGVTTLVDDQQQVWNAFGITEQANYVVLDAGGRVVYNSVNSRWRPMADGAAAVAG